VRLYDLGTLSVWSQWCNRPIISGVKWMMNKVRSATEELLDTEWTDLIMRARRMGMNVEEVRSVIVQMQKSNSAELLNEKSSRFVGIIPGFVSTC